MSIYRDSREVVGIWGQEAGSEHIWGQQAGIEHIWRQQEGSEHIGETVGK